MDEAKQLVLERTYRARLEELTELWTTRECFESWWGPQSFRVEVHELEARQGGTLRYDMIADAPEVIEEVKKAGQPVSHPAHGTFSEFQSHQRLALFPSGASVRMVVTLSALHAPQFTQMQKEGFTSQPTKLDQRFGAAGGKLG